MNNVYFSTRRTGGLALLMLLLCVVSTSPLLAQSSTCVAGSVNNGGGDNWSPDCYLKNDCTVQGNPCQANDVEVTGAFVADANSDPLQACSPGEMVSAFLWANFQNGTGTDRFAVRAYAEVELDGVFTGQTFNNCAFDLIPANSTTARRLIPVNFTCGENINLVNVWVAWDTNTGATCSGANPTTVNCGDHPPSKCFSNIDIGGVAVLVPNFTFGCGEATNEVCFTNLTTGGTPPYTYAGQMVECDGFITAGENEATVTYTAGFTTQNFEVEVTDATGCSVVLMTSISCRKLPHQEDDVLFGDSQGSDIPLTVFPNPANDQLKISLPEWESAPVEVRLLDLLGRTQRLARLSEWSATPYTLEVGDLPAGTYLLRLRNASGDFRGAKVMLIH